MKKPRVSKIAETDPDEILPEYDFSKGRRNPYAARLAKGYTVRIVEDGVVVKSYRVGPTNNGRVSQGATRPKRGPRRKKRA